MHRSARSNTVATRYAHFPVEDAGFSFLSETSTTPITIICSDVQPVLMEKLWWTYPNGNRLVPFKTIADADDDADEEEPLGDDDPGPKVYKEFG